MAANPFVYGEIVTDAAFADREVERDRLARDLLAGQKVFLISPRRYGKSSLVRSVLRDLGRQGVLTVEVTVAASSSYVGFLEAYARALLLAGTPTGRLRQWAGELLGGLRPEVRLDADASGAPRAVVAFPGIRSSRDVARLAAEVFALPGRIAERRGRRLAVALDEFQAITTFDGGSVEHALRAAVQDQRQVGYVFAGSEPSLMEQMLTPKRPFYKAGPVVRLEPIDPDDFAAFIERRFVRSGIRPGEGLGAAVVDLAGNVPYDVQRLAHELCATGSRAPRACSRRWLRSSAPISSPVPPRSATLSSTRCSASGSPGRPTDACRGTPPAGAAGGRTVLPFLPMFTFRHAHGHHHHGRQTVRWNCA